MSTERAPQHIANPWVWAVPAVAAVLMALLWSLDANRAVFLFFNAVTGYTGGSLWANLTTFGDSLALFSMALYFVGRHPRTLWTLLLAAVIATFVVHGLKEWLDVDRPPAVFPHDQINIVGEALEAVSFPSGHTTAAFLLVGVIVTQMQPPVVWRVLLLVAAIMVGISRMAVGVHWPMDVLGGALIGWSAVAIGEWLAPRMEWGYTLRAQRLFAVLFTASAAALILVHDSGYPQARVLEIVIALGSLLVSAPHLRRLFSKAAREDYPQLESDLAEAMAPAPKAGLGSVLLRVAFTALIFWVIFRSVDISAVGDVIDGIIPRRLLFAIVFQLLSTTLAAYRWYLVMQPLGYERTFGFYLRSYFKGMFFNQALPTSIGGDAIRVLDVARCGHRKRDAFRGVFIDRLLGLVALLLLNLVANAFDPDLLPHSVYMTINLLVGAGLAGFALLAMLRRVPMLEAWGPTRLLRHISMDLARVLRDPKQTATQVLLSVGVHLLSLIAVFLIGSSVGLDYSLGTFLIIVPPAILLTLIPISLAGWGVREGALVGLFAMVGANQAVVLSMSLLYGLVLIIASLPGLTVYLSARHRI